MLPQGFSVAETPPPVGNKRRKRAAAAPLLPITLFIHNVQNVSTNRIDEIVMVVQVKSIELMGVDAETTADWEDRDQLQHLPRYGNITKVKPFAAFNLSYAYTLGEPVGFHVSHVTSNVFKVPAHVRVRLFERRCTDGGTVGSIITGQPSVEHRRRRRRSSVGLVFVG